MSSQFDGDLAEGKVAEDAFARILLGTRELWEHKKDRQCSQTGNVAIEFETSRFPDGAGDRWPSGIAVCEAYWFVIEFAAEQRLVMPTEAVKDVARVALRDGRDRWIGDNHRFHNVLVPVGWFVATPKAPAALQPPLFTPGLAPA